MSILQITAWKRIHITQMLPDRPDHDLPDLDHPNQRVGTYV